MSMPASFAIKVGIFSMRRRMVRTILALLPCVLLISVLFIGATIPNGLVNELDNKILKKAESQQELVVLNSFLFSQPDTTQTGFQSGAPAMSFNKSNYTLATENEFVKEVYPQTGSVPGFARELSSVSNASLNLNGISKEFARTFTSENFEYKPGEPIPLILDVSSVSGQKINWGDLKEFTLDYNNLDQVKERMPAQVLKPDSSLVGSTFTIEFASFPMLPEGFSSMSGGAFSNKAKYTKLTDNDKDILMRRLKELYSPYWDIGTLSQPVEYKFKIVALTQGQNGIGTMIPNDAVSTVWNALYARQRSARTTKEIDKETLASNQQKIILKDGKINAGSIFSYTSLTLDKASDVSAWQVDISSLSVPGIIVESVKNKKGQDEFKEVVIPAITLDNFNPSGAVVRLKDPDMREKFGKYLNDNGMFFFDQSPLAVIRGIRKWSNIIVTWMTIILGLVVAFILLTTVSRFVADSRKEIGVWRAIGATRTDIGKLVLVRMGILVSIGIVAGVALGYLGSFFIARGLASQFNTATSTFDPYAGPSASNIVSSMVIGLLGGNVPELSMKNLLATNWPLLLSRLALLTVISLVVGLIPALRATRISPITAIRDSE